MTELHFKTGYLKKEPSIICRILTSLLLMTVGVFVCTGCGYKPLLTHDADSRFCVFVETAENQTAYGKVSATLTKVVRKGLRSYGITLVAANSKSDDVSRQPGASGDAAIGFANSNISTTGKTVGVQDAGMGADEIIVGDAPGISRKTATASSFSLSKCDRRILKLTILTMDDSPGALTSQKEMSTQNYQVVQEGVQWRGTVEASLVDMNNVSVAGPVVFSDEAHTLVGPSATSEYALGDVVRQSILEKISRQIVLFVLENR